MDQNGIKTLEDLGEKVERKTRQDKTVNSDVFFMSTLSFAKKAEMDEPLWGRVRGEWVDNRIRDEWLSAVVQQEPHLASVLSTAVTLDANRRFRLVGGRNQVVRFSKVFNSFQDGKGFREYQELMAKDYYNADAGGIGEIETDGKNGPLLSLYHVDPTKVRLGRNGLLKYDNDIWKPEWYYRLASQKSTQDRYNYLGFCAVSRCLKLAQTMIALVTHNVEKLGYLAPNGILFVSAEDITQSTWDEAVDARKAMYVTNTGNQYFDELMTVFDRNIKGELIEFSKMPEKFDTFMFTDYMLKGYALAFNRDVRTFWSLNSGNFGGGTEAALQDEKATYAGGAEFILASQEWFRKLVPGSVLFEYEVEDTRGKLQKAEVEKAVIESAKILFDIGLEQEQILAWLADRGVIPEEWSTIDKDVVAEMGILKERYIETEAVQRAINRFPDEPIVVYESPGMYHPHGKIRTLWKSGKEAVGRSWVNSKTWLEKPVLTTRSRQNKEYRYIPQDELKELIAKGKSADYIELKNRAYQKTIRQKTMEDYNNELERGEFMFCAGAYNYLDQVESPDENEVEALLLAAAILARTSTDISTLESLLRVSLPVLVFNYLLDLRRYSDDAEEDAELDHPERWDSRLGYMSQFGILYGADDLETERTWVIGKTERHCSDCDELDGQTKTVAEWIEDGRVPKSSSLECGGYNCDCSFV